MHQASHLSQLKDFLYYLSTVKGDLSSITAPPFVLAPKSAIEIPATWASRHALFLEPADEPDPARRALLVAKNYACSLKQLASNGCEEAAGRKPLNPFLGELFFGRFAAPGNGGDDSATEMIAEQVSHHPPVTACFMYNRERGISSEGFVAQELVFSMISGVTVRQLGYAVIRDERHGERHLMTMPTLHVRGIASGQPYTEFEGPCYISSSSGYLTCIDFDCSRGPFGLGTGPRNCIRVRVYASPVDMEKDRNRDGRALFTITGQWSGRMTIKDASGTVVEDFDVDDVALTDLTVRSIDQQTPWESRRAWRDVIDGIRAGDFAKVAASKTALEKYHRERRKREARKGAEWKRLFFARDKYDNEEYRDLLELLPADAAGRVDAAKTDGVWRFVGVEAAARIKEELGQGNKMGG